MNQMSASKRVLLSIGLVVFSSVAFAATGSFAVDALFDASAGSSETTALVLAGLALMATIARRRSGARI
jgi:MYXO-CTERM domain-containing protein